MSATSVKATRRELRKALGSPVTETVTEIVTNVMALDERTKALALLTEPLRRETCWGRVKWLIFGR